MEYSRRYFRVVVFVFALLIVAFLVSPVTAQGLMRGSGLDLAPSNPTGMPGSTGGLPGGSDSIYLNSGMFRDILGPIPNLEIGYLYQFGNKIRTGRLSLDYVFPATVWDNQAVFAEAHGEFTNFWKTLQRLFRSGNTTTTYSGFPERTDLSFGGGYRKLLGDSLMLGVNGFYDARKLGRRWYGSGGVGLEMATLGAGNDLVELTFNYYGDIFQGRNSIINAFRNGPSNFDVSARYSIELGDYGPDLRLKATGYQFDIGTKQYGWNTEAEVRTRNGMFSVKAGTGHDPVNGWYHTVGGFVNVGLDFANLVNGKSPFEMPEPIFRSPRNLRRLLTQKVDRSDVAPPFAVAARKSGDRRSTEPCAVVVLMGPFYILYGHNFLVGGVPNLTGMACNSYVKISWAGITRADNHVRFQFLDGTRIVRHLVGINMYDSLPAGHADRILDSPSPTSDNHIHYGAGHEDLAGGHGAWVMFEFF